jgi:hypothetical protein
MRSVHSSIVLVAVLALFIFNKFRQLFSIFVRTVGTHLEDFTLEGSANSPSPSKHRLSISYEDTRAALEEWELSLTEMKQGGMGRERNAMINACERVLKLLTLHFTIGRPRLSFPK